MRFQRCLDTVERQVRLTAIGRIDGLANPHSSVNVARAAGEAQLSSTTRWRHDGCSFVHERASAQGDGSDGPWENRASLSFAFPTECWACGRWLGWLARGRCRLAAIAISSRSKAQRPWVGADGAIRHSISQSRAGTLTNFDSVRTPRCRANAAVPVRGFGVLSQGTSDRRPHPWPFSKPLNPAPAPMSRRHRRLGRHRRLKPWHC